MGKLKAAILGYGRSGSSMHARALETVKDFEVVAVCDIDPARREQAVKRFGCRVYDEHRRMLRREELDLVSVVTRSDQHCAMACDCLRAGTNVLVTKPWALNAAQGRRMIRAAEKAGRQLLPWLPSRWSPDFVRLKELVSAGTIGRVFHVRRFEASFALRDDWQMRRRCGGGYLLNWGPHVVDTAVRLSGGRVRSVYGRMRRLYDYGDAESTFFASIELEGGVLVQAEYSFAARGLPNWFVQGTGGTIVVEGRNIEIHAGTPELPADPTRYAGAKGSNVTIARETVPGKLFGNAAAVYRQVAAALRGEAPFPVSPADALELSLLLDDIRASAEKDRLIRRAP